MTVIQFPDRRMAEPYCYSECGLDDVYLLSGYEAVETGEGAGVSVRHADELHDEIGRYLATQRKILHGKEIRFLRKEMDLTQADLGKLLGISDQQVARWEKDQSQVSGPADYLLRALYLEATDRDFDLRALVTHLEETDAERVEGRQLFTPTRDGWKRAA